MTAADDLAVAMNRESPAFRTLHAVVRGWRDVAAVYAAAGRGLGGAPANPREASARFVQRSRRVSRPTRRRRSLVSGLTDRVPVVDLNTSHPSSPALGCRF